MSKDIQRVCHQYINRVAFSMLAETSSIIISFKPFNTIHLENKKLLQYSKNKDYFNTTMLLYNILKTFAERVEVGICVSFEINKC